MGRPGEASSIVGGRESVGMDFQVGKAQKYIMGGLTGSLNKHSHKTFVAGRLGTCVGG